MADCKSCENCAYINVRGTDYPCNECDRNATDKWKVKTNFDVCCESIDSMAQIIDIAKIGWTKEQILEWLQSEAE